MHFLFDIFPFLATVWATNFHAFLLLAVVFVVVRSFSTVLPIEKYDLMHLFRCTDEIVCCSFRNRKTKLKMAKDFILALLFSASTWLSLEIN